MRRLCVHFKKARIQMERRSVRRVRLDEVTLMKHESAGHTEAKQGEIKQSDVLE